MTSTSTIATTSELASRVLEAVNTAIVGKTDSLRLVLAALFAGGHVIIEDNPGLGKTLLARSFAQTLGLAFKRVQFTPDLLPADITGSYIFDQRAGQFAFREGPLFANMVLGDEINRTPPKTQAALLEAMQERQVTVEGTTFQLPRPFHVIATANPIEYEGTYTLPEAQLDRFLVRVSLGYPQPAEELDVVDRRIARRREEIELAPVTDADGLLAASQAVELVEVETSLRRYCVDLVAATRAAPDLLVGASPRGSLALVLMSRALAVVAGRDYVTPEDVKAVAVPALAHRITVQPEMWMRGVTGVDVIRRVLSSVDAPPTSTRRQRG